MQMHIADRIGAKSVIVQEEHDVDVRYLGEGSEHWIKNKEALTTVDWAGGWALGSPETAYLAEFAAA